MKLFPGEALYDHHIELASSLINSVCNCVCILCVNLPCYSLIVKFMQLKLALFYAVYLLLFCERI